jgi:hypothetical protein
LANKRFPEIGMAAAGAHPDANPEDVQKSMTTLPAIAGSLQLLGVQMDV